MGADHPLVPADATWVRSSFSSPDDDGVVEIAMLPDGGVALRSSTGDEPPLVYTAGEWEAFILGVRAGEFDEP